MINVEDVLAACEVRKSLANQALIIDMFIFETQRVDEPQSRPAMHLYAEIYGGEEPRLERLNNFVVHLASTGSSVVCPMCRDRFAARRFGAHVKKHKIRTLEITESLHNQNEAYIQQRIDSLSKPVILPKLKVQKKKKRRKTLIFSAGAPGLGKKN